MPDSRTVTVLLVEDDDIDRKVVHRAFAKHKIANPIVEARDGLEALEIIRGKNGTAPLPRPYLVLLDLNMPRMNGIEFLREVRGDNRLRDSVIFVLTTSRGEQDRVQAYELNVAGYMVKADAGAEFINAVEMLDHYWRVVEFPS
ncbi:MAG: response regulator [Phycisphaerae bacterium]|jgi:CheY-like chemotaxis protein